MTKKTFSSFTTLRTGNNKTRLLGGAKGVDDVGLTREPQPQLPQGVVTWERTDAPLHQGSTL